MSISVKMPQLGESVTEGTVTRWLKKEGDAIAADEPLLEVSTDKIDTEIPSPASGVLARIVVGEDETVDVGVELAVIEAVGESSAPAAPAAPATPPAAAPAPPAPAPVAAPAPTPTPAPASAPAPTPPPAPPVTAPAPAPVAPPRPPAPAPAPAAAPVAAPRAPVAADLPTSDADAVDLTAYVTPLVRKLAAEHGVDLGELTGTGVGRRIRKQDVLAAAEAKAASAPPASGTISPPAPASELRGRTEPMSRLRAVLASRMVDSLREAAQLTTVVEVDVTRVARLRESAKVDFEAREGIKLSFLPFFALAAVEALKQHPVLNASVDTEANTITYHEAEHLGVAVDTERGLLVPVVHNAGDLNLAGLARKIADLAGRTRGSQVSPDELSNGTFTITNSGSRGALFDTPILLPPQVGILGTGSVVKRAVVIDDPELGETISVRSMVYLALTSDQRLIDGADAARFLATIKARLEDGRFEADLGL
jgi:pyruvate dehydrogenase E2 component (dihydrolipoamide acetyltransferase)